MGRDSTFYDPQFSDSDHDLYEPASFEPDLVFIAMPFSENETDDVYLAIKDECERLSLKPVRVDEKTGSGLIIKDIIRLIEQAEFIIFDLSEERPNVYYELGYAHGVGNEAEDILLVANKETNLHFDVSPLRVQFYDSTEKLRSIIKTNMKKMIEITRE